LPTIADPDLTRAEVSRSRSGAGALVLAAAVSELKRPKFTTQYLGPPNGSVTQLRRGNQHHWRRGAPLAATNELSAGRVCKRRDATALGGLPSRLGRRASRRPAVSLL